ncbi:MAG: energy transducer TonB [Bacteroidia bacterium]
MYKTIILGIVGCLSLASVSAQTKYWNTSLRRCGKLSAVYYSKDETKDDRIERRFYTKRGKKLVNAHILSLESPREVIGRIYFWPNGQVLQEILYDESEGARKSVHYWSEEGEPLGAEINLPDSSGFARNIAEYPDGKLKYRTTSQFNSYYIQKAAWYPNGNRWFELESSKGQIKALIAYDTLGQVLDLSLLTEDKISWKLEPELQNQAEVSRRIGYPQIARSEGMQGRVMFRLLINPEGKLMAYTLVESPGDILTFSVEQYLWDLQFSPGQSDAGEAVYAWVDYFADFKLLK